LNLIVLSYFTKQIIRAVIVKENVEKWCRGVYLISWQKIESKLRLNQKKRNWKLDFRLKSSFKAGVSNSVAYAGRILKKKSSWRATLGVNMAMRATMRGEFYHNTTKTVVSDIICVILIIMRAACLIPLL